MMKPEQTLGARGQFQLEADMSHALIWMAGPDSHCIWFNTGWLQFTGRDLVQEVGEGWTAGVHPNDLADCIQVYSEHFNAREPFLLEYRLRRYDGQYRWILDSGAPAYDANGTFLGYNGVCFDIHDRKLAETELRIAATVFESQQGMVIADYGWAITQVNGAFCKLMERSAFDIRSQPLSCLLDSASTPDQFVEICQQVYGEAGFWCGEIWLRKPSGTAFPVLLSLTAVRDEFNTISHFVGCFTDITARVAQENSLRDLAFYDPLTGLANRRLLLDRLAQLLVRCERNFSCGAVIYIDLDLFKSLNDTQGHAAGDKALQAIAQRLKHQLRESDTVSRVGGDEFVILLDDLGTDSKAAATYAQALAEKLRADIVSPIELNVSPPSSWQLSASIGVAVFTGSDISADTVLNQADQAMYEAKRTGRNSVRCAQNAPKANRPQL